MPIDTRELKNIHPQRDGSVGVQEVLTAAVGHVITHSYKAVSEAQAITDMNARNVTPQLKNADLADFLLHVEAPAKNQPNTFDFTGRDITLLEGRDWGEEGGGGCSLLVAIGLAWRIKGLTPPNFNTIRDRAGHDVDEGDRVKDKAVAQDDAEDTIDDVVEVNV